MVARCDRCRQLTRTEGQPRGGRYELCPRCVDALVASHAYVRSDWVFAPAPIVATAVPDAPTQCAISGAGSEDLKG